MRTDAWGTRMIGVALLALALGACGDDDDGNTDGTNNDAGPGTAGRDSGSSNAGSGGTTAPRDPLPDDTAGKECTDDADCGSGTCATMVQGLDGMQAMAPGGYCMGACSTTADCGAGGTCVMGFGMMGLCYASCTAATQATDCREGYVCGPMTMTCRPAPRTDQLDDNVAGDECAADGDCPGGGCSTMRGMTALPGGYCSGACLEDSHCGAGGICRRPGSGAGSCYAACTDDGDCTRDGYRCRNIGGGQMGCNPAPDPLPDDTTGKACTGDADCGGATGSCAADLPVAMGDDAPAPGGYCTIACSVDLDCGAAGSCITTRGGGRCFKPCTTMGDCREGYACAERGQEAELVCTPEVLDEPDAG
jgi:hypothetical protein